MTKTSTYMIVFENQLGPVGVGPRYTSIIQKLKLGAFFS